MTAVATPPAAEFPTWVGERSTSPRRRFANGVASAWMIGSVIVALIPLALRGIQYRPLGAAAVLRRNVLVYGLGGVVIPFAGIKLIDMILVAVGLAGLA